MFDSLFLWAGTSFRGREYLALLKFGAICCGFADIIVVALAVRMMDIIRRRPASKRTFAVLAIFALLMPLHLLPHDTTKLFVVMFFIFLPPYAILVWTAARESKYFMAYVREKLAREDARKEVAKNG